MDPDETTTFCRTIPKAPGGLIRVPCSPRSDDFWCHTDVTNELGFASFTNNGSHTNRSSFFGNTNFVSGRASRAKRRLHDDATPIHCDVAKRASRRAMRIFLGDFIGDIVLSPTETGSSRCSMRARKFVSCISKIFSTFLHNRISHARDCNPFRAQSSLLLSALRANFRPNAR